MTYSITTLLIALAATIVSIVGDVFINQATILSGPRATWSLIIGCIIFGSSGLLWFFVFKKLSFSGVVLLYLFLSVIVAVGVDYFRYGHVPDVRAWAGLGLFLLAMWMMRDYLNH